MHSIFLAVLACLMLLAPARSGIVAHNKAVSHEPLMASVKRELRLSGGFIQYWNYMMEWDWSDPSAPSRMPYPVYWGALVKSMREIGMTTIVIQQTEYGENGDKDPTRLYKVSDTSPTKPRSDDPTEKILIAADPDMTVFTGLVDAPPAEWDNTTKKSPAELEAYLLDEKQGLATKNIAAADRLWALYHRHTLSTLGISRSRCGTSAFMIATQRIETRRSNRCGASGRR
jgi:hypothetical protein